LQIAQNPTPGKVAASTALPHEQLWLFWAAPIAGALLAGAVFRALFEPDEHEPAVTGR
jgi:glycerol uptake facilitator-like aquaporin